MPIILWGEEVIAAYQKRLDGVMKKLAARKEEHFPADSFEVKKVIGEYGFIIKQLYQLQDEKELMLSIIPWYRDERVAVVTDEQYGPGMAAFFVGAVEKFYQGSKS